jgi:hypothetical protein
MSVGVFHGCAGTLAQRRAIVAVRVRNVAFRGANPAEGRRKDGELAPSQATGNFLRSSSYREATKA